MAQLVWADVAPIFYNRCDRCHNQYGYTGVSFLTASETAANAATIQGYLSSGYMPPWKPDTTYTRFTHENLIGAGEKAAVLSWIATGALPGDTTLAAPPPTYSQYQLIGTPDLELQIPTFTSNAISDDSYVCFSLPSGLATDRILRAYEIIPGDPSMVHHVIVNVDSTGTVASDLSGTCYTATGDYSIAGYAPGAPPTVFPGTGPLKMGITIKAGSNIIMQLHYPYGTAGKKDSTRIRMYFYPIGETGVRPVYISTPLQNWGLNILANQVKTYTKIYPTVGSIPNWSVFAAFPHAHKICTTITNYAYTATDTIPLIKINNWDFNWQGYYTFKNLVHIPSGYKLYSTHTYDNTSSNPNNPSSPPVNVAAGTSTNDEMFFDSFMWLYYMPGDENISVDSLFAIDPLFNSVAEQNYVNTHSLASTAYPNPFTDNVTISYSLDEPSKVTIDIYSLSGKCVKSINDGFEKSGKQNVIWDGKMNGQKLSDGTYIYRIRAGQKISYGRITLVK